MGRFQFYAIRNCVHLQNLSVARTRSQFFRDWAPIFFALTLKSCLYINMKQKWILIYLHASIFHSCSAISGYTQTLANILEKLKHWNSCYELSARSELYQKVFLPRIQFSHKKINMSKFFNYKNMARPSKSFGFLTSKNLRIVFVYFLSEIAKACFNQEGRSICIFLENIEYLYSIGTKKNL